MLSVCAIQLRHGDDVPGNLDRARSRIGKAAEDGAELCVLPEYFFFAPGTPAPEVADDVRAFLADVSADQGVAVAGNVVEVHDGDPVNLGLVYDAGRCVLEQPKLHPMPAEADEGIVPGDGVVVAEVRGRPLGVVVCADVIYPEVAQLMALRGAHILVNPVMSPYRPDDPSRTARESLYVARAWDSGAFVVKAGGIRDGEVVGRSLVAAPWGLAARYGDDTTEQLLHADLDMDRLEAFRKDKARFPKRRPEAYRGLVESG